MYDIIKCEVEETRGHWDIKFQTKDLDSLLLHYELTHEGLFQLTELEGVWNEKKIDKKRIEYTGKLAFYGQDKDENYVLYWALLDFGKVLWIKRIE